MTFRDNYRSRVQRSSSTA